MINELENPFSVTKATEFTNSEINEYWVNFNTKADVSIQSLLNPNEFLPKYIIGGKGCGKTHILRYFSYPLQNIRYQDDVAKLLATDKYIGLYSIIGGMNSSRFKEKGIEQAEWEAVFEYYFELYICDSLLHTIDEIVKKLNIQPEVESKVLASILPLFTNNKELNTIQCIQDLIAYLKELRDKIDSQILNAAFKRKLDYNEVRVLFTPGDLIFGIPGAIESNIESFKNVKFICILDEYEKLFEWQKVFVNTLVWDKKTPVTFWIGARRYGYTTRGTKSGESMKQGSEFQEVNLDDIIRSNEELYVQFAEKLYTNRLIKYYQVNGLNVNQNDIGRKFCERFESYDEEKMIQFLGAKNRKEYKHLKELRKILSYTIKNKIALDLTDDKEIDGVINAIVSDTGNNVLDQKYKIFLLYKLWHKASKKETFQNVLSTINEEYRKFKGNTESLFREIKDKRKKDFMAQLFNEFGIENPEYCGIDKYIDISSGNPRSFILSLKKTIEYSKIRGEKPLEDGGFISIESQCLAINDTAKWFYEDAEVIGENGRQMYVSLRNLTDYFALYRFCDKPTETTVSSFYIKAEELSANSLAIIELMKMHSVLIESEDGRLEKNTGRQERMFQLNKILVPLWDLPAVRRGTVYLSKEVADSIFDSDFNSNFDRYYKEKKSELFAPDFLKKDADMSKNSLF